MCRARGVLGLLVVCACALTAASAGIDVYPNTEYSGGTPPDGSGPWLHAQFTDASGGVDVTLTSLLIGPTEFVSEWAFNLDPALDPNHLQFALVSGGPAATISTGTNFYAADGDGLYDILFTFPTAPPSSRFNDSDAVTYKITSSDPISAASFNFLSAPHGSHGPYVTAAHVQGTGGGGVSGWVTVPEPSALALLAAAGIAAAASRRR